MRVKVGPKQWKDLGPGRAVHGRTRTRLDIDEQLILAALTGSSRMYSPVAPRSAPTVAIEVRYGQP